MGDHRAAYSRISSAPKRERVEVYDSEYRVSRGYKLASFVCMVGAYTMEKAFGEDLKGYGETMPFNAAMSMLSTLLTDPFQVWKSHRLPNRPVPAQVGAVSVYDAPYIDDYGGVRRLPSRVEIVALVDPAAFPPSGVTGWSFAMRMPGGAGTAKVEEISLTPNPRWSSCVAYLHDAPAIVSDAAIEYVQSALPAPVVQSSATEMAVEPPAPAAPPADAEPTQSSLPDAIETPEKVSAPQKVTATASEGSTMTTMEIEKTDANTNAAAAPVLSAAPIVAAPSNAGSNMSEIALSAVQQELKRVREELARSAEEQRRQTQANAILREVAERPTLAMTLSAVDGRVQAQLDGLLTFSDAVQFAAAVHRVISARDSNTMPKTEDMAFVCSSVAAAEKLGKDVAALRETVNSLPRDATGAIATPALSSAPAPKRAAPETPAAAPPTPAGMQETRITAATPLAAFFH